MLTSFFKKSGPLNFLVVSLYILLFAVVSFFLENNESFDLYELGKSALLVLLLVFSLFLLDFIVRKNGLAQMNAYTILFFATLVCFFPFIFKDIALVGASVCVLFALRRMFSLQSIKNTERKILDASLWLAVATFLYFPSILMVMGLLWAIFIMPIKKLRYFFIPVVGFLGAFLIATAYYLWVDDDIEWFFNLFVQPSWDFTAYGIRATLIAIAFVSASFLWALFFRLGAISRLQKKERPNFLLVVYVVFISLTMILFSHKKDTTELLFAFAPMAIILANYVEHDSDKWFKELLLWLFILLPFLRFFVG